MDQDSYINELTTAGTLTGAEAVPVFQSGSTFQVLLSAIATFIRTGYATLTGVETLTNKRITARVRSTAYDATLTPNIDNYDVVANTAIAGGITIAAPTGTPTDYQELTIFLTDDGSSRLITWNGVYANYGGALPANTNTGKTHVLKFSYKSSVYRCYYSAVQP